ncbi:MAG TPA: MFS transporter [Thermomicrobiales bacterium]|nr:MFS transporter [Thermomicrobiales bacterium]
MRPRHLLLAYGPLLTLMLGHMTNDLIGGILPILVIRAREEFSLSIAQGGLIVLAYTSAASLSQPFFGYICDRFPKRWFAPVALLGGGLFAASWAVAPTYESLLVLAFIAGLGSGAYHPFGATNAAAVTAGPQRNTALSVYTFGGSFGFGLGPVVAAVLFTLGGNSGLLFLALPASIVAWLIWTQMAKVSAAQAAVTSASGTVDGARSRPEWGLLARVISIVMLRSWVVLSVFQYLPAWFQDLGYSSAFYATLTTVTILSGAIGTLLGGLFVNRIGPRRLLLGSFSLLVIPLILLTMFPGPQAFVFAIAFGLLGDAGLAVPLVAAQRLLPGRAGVASGLILGLGFITGGIGVPITGLIADNYGIPAALLIVAPLTLIGTGIALTLPSRIFTHAPSAPPPPAATTVPAGQPASPGT